MPSISRFSTTISLARNTGWGASALAMACVSPAVFAQDADEDAGSSTGEIVVTAQFREQNLQDTPLAITAVNSEMLEQRSQTNLTDIANQAPSVDLRQNSASFGPSITATIRGMGQVDFNPLLEPGVGIYIDDVYYPRLTGANFELVDVERVEILRGPQGTLTGRNSEGGAIRYVSKRPDGTFGGTVQATYGSRDNMNLRGAVQFPISGDGNLSGRVSGAWGQQDGYVQGYDYGCMFPASGVPSYTTNSDCKTADFGNKDYYAGRVALRYNPSNAVDVMLVGDYTHDSTWNAGEVLLYANNTNPNTATENGLPFDSRFICGKYCNYASFQNAPASWQSPVPPLNGLPVAGSDTPLTSFYEGWGVSLHAEFEMADWASLTNITAYRGFDANFSNDTDLSPARIDSPVIDLKSRFFSTETRISVNPADWLEATVGTFYSYEKTDQDTQTDIRYAGVPLQFIGGGPVKVSSFAVFGTAFIRPIEDLTITLGGRYTDERKQTTYQRLNYDRTTPNRFVDPVGARYGINYWGPDPLDANTNGDLTETVRALNYLTSGYSGTRFDYRASVDYRISDEFLVYATTGTGFKGGGVTPRPFNAAQVISFGPEELTAYEVGVKSDLFGRMLRLNVSGYLNKFTNAQIGLLSCPQLSAGPCAVIVNGGDATIKGVEAEVSMHLFDGFDFNGSLSYLDWNWDCVQIQAVRPLNPGESNSCSSDPAVVGALASPPRGVTKWQWSVGAQYRFDIGNSGSLTPRIDVAYQGDMNGRNTVSPPGSPQALYGVIENYTIANGRLTYRTPDEDWSVALAVTNIFDKYYFNQKFDLVAAGAGMISGLPGRPREWSVTVKRTF
ncbi:MAG: TonB-dependent receptor [Sphingomonadaceae bacterium]